MITDFLQSLKIIRLAKEFAYMNLPEFFDLAGLKGYRKFVKSRELASQDSPLSKRIQKALIQNPNEYFKSFVSEIFYDLLDSPINLEMSKSKNTKENPQQIELYRSVFHKMILSDSRYQAAYQNFSHQIDMLSDKRLAASEIEELFSAEANNKDILVYEVDWTHTTKQNLEIYPLQASYTAKNLPTKILEEKLAHLWAEIFFESSKLIYGWQSIIYNEQAEINFYCPEYMLSADSRLKNFACTHILQNRRPQNYTEYKFVLGLNGIKALCPSVNVKDIWANYLNKHYEIPQKNTPSADYMQKMQEVGLSAGVSKAVDLTPLSHIKELHFSKNLQKDRRFKNSSPLVILAIALMIYVLLKYF